MMELNPLELEHYNRHLKLPGFGLEKQLRLKTARVLIVGAGGLGCPIGLYLAAAGVGTIGVADFDKVERSNLQRQVAHNVERLNQPKADSLIDSMRAVNPLVSYRIHPERLDADNVTAVIRDYDLILDGTDNFGTRYLLADACHLNGIPLLQGAVYEYHGQMSLFVPNEGPCYRCVFREPPQKNALAPCAEIGVLGVIPGTVGLLMATEAVKFLTGLGTSIRGKLLTYDALTQTMRQIALSRDEECPLCGNHPSILEVRDIPVTACAVADEADFQVDREAAEDLIRQGALVLDVREPFEFSAGHLVDAVNIPLGGLETGITSVQSDLEKRPALVYCQKGMRSLEAVRCLREMGYENTFSLTGGLNAWKQALVLPVLS